MNYFKTRLLNRKQHLDLFLLIVFPIHLWSFVTILQQGDWVSHRSGIFDAIGMFSYAALTALVESAFVFLLFVIVSFLLPAQWSVKKRLSLLGYFYLLLLLSAMSSQWFFMLDRSIGTFSFRVVYHLNRLYRLTLPLFIAGVFGGVAGIAYLQNRFTKLTDIMLGLMERISLLSYLYLFIDVIAIIVIIIRNI